MADPYLVPCLVTLRDEFNRLNPNRDKSSDGWIGDASHQSGSSDHNPASDGGVHAIDVDETGGWPDGCTMEKMVQYIIAECRKSGESGMDRGRLKYVIYERRIWSASNGWQEEYYDGSNAHDKHVHFSGEYSSEYENDTRSWGLYDKFGDDMPTVDEFWNAAFPDPYDESPNPRMVKAKDWLRYVPSDADVKNVGKKVDTANGKLDQMIASLTGDMEALAQSIVDKLLEQAPPGTITQQQIVDAVKQAFREGSAV